MARLLGTGKDPNGQYGDGVLFDVPRDDPHFAELVDNGWAVTVDPHDDPARDTVGIAAAVVRGDALLHPAERDIADHIGGRAHAIVQKQDPDAVALRADEEPVAARPQHNPDERPYGNADEPNARTSNWEDGTSAGDVATHTTLAAEPTPAPLPDAGTPDKTQPPEAGGQQLSADSTADELRAEYDRRLAAGEIEEIPHGKGSGKDGNIVKDDYAKALGYTEGA